MFSSDFDEFDNPEFDFLEFSENYSTKSNSKLKPLLYYLNNWKIYNVEDEDIELEYPNGQSILINFEKKEDDVEIFYVKIFNGEEELCDITDEDEIDDLITQVIERVFP
jgi:hypothetical protein